MRIALTGAAGIGKTTLARALAEQFTAQLSPAHPLPLLEEQFSSVVKAFNSGSMHDERVRAMCRQACLSWLEQRALAYATQQSFVEDRCALDVLFRWLQSGLSDQDNALTRTVVAQVRSLLDTLDFVVILPLVETDERHNHDGLRRAGSTSRLLRAHSLALGLAIQYMPAEKLILVPSTCDGVEARLEFVRTYLAAHPRRSA